MYLVTRLVKTWLVNKTVSHFTVRTNRVALEYRPSSIDYMTKKNSLTCKFNVAVIQRCATINGKPSYTLTIIQRVPGGVWF